MIGIYLFISSIASVRIIQAWRCSQMKLNCTVYKYPPIPKDAIVVNWGVGGGLWPYYIGIARYIQEHYDLNNCVFIGHSAGVEPAYWLAMGISIDIVWEFYLDFLEHIDGCHTKALWNWTYFCNKCHMKFINNMKMYDDNPDQLLNLLNERCFIAASELAWNWGVWPTLRPVYLGSYTSHQSAIKCMVASYHIPFLTAPMFRPFQAIKVLSSTTKKIYLSKFIDPWLSQRGNGKNYKHPEGKMLNIWPRKWRNFPESASWVWSNIDYNKSLYKLGYNDAHSHQECFSILKRNGTI
jgi:hypothetical protein